MHHVDRIPMSNGYPLYLWTSRFTAQGPNFYFIDSELAVALEEPDDVEEFVRFARKRADKLSLALGKDRNTLPSFIVTEEAAKLYYTAGMPYYLRVRCPYTQIHTGIGVVEKLAAKCIQSMISGYPCKVPVNFYEFQSKHREHRGAWQ